MKQTVYVVLYGNMDMPEEVLTDVFEKEEDAIAAAYKAAKFEYDEMQEIDPEDIGFSLRTDVDIENTVYALGRENNQVPGEWVYFDWWKVVPMQLK